MAACGTFNRCIVVVRTDTSKMCYLCKLLQVGSVLYSYENLSVVREVLLDNKTIVPTVSLILFLGLECFMGVETCQQIHLDVLSGVVNEHYTSFVHLVVR